jgi:regulator of sigma E protease
LTLFSAIILLGILIFVHELGHFIVAKLSGVKVLKFSLGFGPKILGKKIGETEYMISAVPLGGYVKMLGEEPGEELEESEKIRAFNQQTLFKRALIVFAGPLFNILLTFVIFTAVLSVGIPVNVPVVSKLLPTIDEVLEDSPAAEAGLKKGDTVISIDDTVIDTWFDMVRIISMNPGKVLTVVVKRNDELLTLKVVPRAVEERDLKGKKITIGRIGIRKLDGGFFDTVRSKSAIDAPLSGMVATYKMGFFIIDSIRMLVTGKVSVKNLGGPVTIVKESGRAARLGIVAYFMFMALLSVNLGILNLLPIPILDGGHLLLFAIEGVKGKPLSDKTVIIVHKIGYLFLIILMAFALYNDILRIFTNRE